MRRIPAGTVRIGVLAFLAGLTLIPGPLRAAPGPPEIDTAALEALAPGWQKVESRGDDRSGRIAYERSVYPMFYLHWMPIAEAGHGLTPQLATRLVEGLFEARFIDQPLVPVKVRMPAHEGFQLDSTTQRGEMRTRWFVWPCPVSKRILIVDANESLQAGTPPELMAWMEQMARTVRCHVDARVERFGHLSRLNEIEGADISHAYPRMWAPIQGYRVQKNFAGADFAVAASGPVTAEKGQWLTLASDSSMRLFLSWGPPIDEPMSYEILSQRVQDHWRERSLDVMQLDSLAVGDVWINNGIVRFGPLGKPIPPTPLHKYRAWDWQRDGVAYFAVADIGGVRHGRRDAPQAHETWNRLLEQLFETIRIAPAGAD